MYDWCANTVLSKMTVLVLAVIHFPSVHVRSKDVFTF